MSVEADRDAVGRVIVCVRDTGIGIAEEAIPLAFEPFRQIDSTLSRKYEGTGLGLSLVKTLVELHQGEVRIESTPGEGTAVFVTFPAARALDGRQVRRARPERPLTPARLFVEWPHETSSARRLCCAPCPPGRRSRRSSSGGAVARSAAGRRWTLKAKSLPPAAGEQTRKPRPRAPGVQKRGLLEKPARSGAGFSAGGKRVMRSEKVPQHQCLRARQVLKPLGHL